MKNTLITAGLLLSGLALGTTAQAQDAPQPKTPQNVWITQATKTGTVTFPDYYLWEYGDFDMVGVANARNTDEIVKKPLKN